MLLQVVILVFLPSELIFTENLSGKAAIKFLGREQNILRNFTELRKSGPCMLQQCRQFMFQSNVYPARSLQNSI